MPCRSAIGISGARPQVSCAICMSGCTRGEASPLPECIPPCLVVLLRHEQEARNPSSTKCSPVRLNRHARHAAPPPPTARALYVETRVNALLGALWWGGVGRGGCWSEVVQQAPTPDPSPRALAFVARESLRAREG